MARGSLKDLNYKIDLRDSPLKIINAALAFKDIISAL